MSRPEGIRRALAEFEPAGFFALRSPTLPFDAFAATSGVDAESRLRALVSRGEIRERIFVASPSVAERMETWLAGETPPDDSRQIEQAITRYVERMCWRSTPFGLFAGTSVGRLGRESRIAFASRDLERATTRIDTEVLYALAGSLARDPEIRRHLRYRPNSSLHVQGDELAFVEARVGSVRAHAAASVPRSAHLEAVLCAAKEGASADQLVAALLGADGSIAPVMAMRFVDALIDAQVLVDDLEPPVVGAEPLAYLIDRLAGIGAAAATRDVLVGARDALARLDGGSRPSAIDEYRAIAASLATLPGRPAFAKSFHVVLTRPTAEAELDERVMREALAGAAALCAMSPAPRDPLAEFRREFEARYGEREVPLADVLGDLTGIGFEPSLSSLARPPALLRGIAPPPSTASEHGSWGPRERWLAARVAAAARSGAGEVVLDDASLSALARPPAPLSDTFAVVASLHAAGPEDLAGGRYRIHLRQLVSPTAASVLGRFAATDDTLAEHVVRLTEREQELSPDALLAEVVHCPHPKVGNVANRPTLRRHEILFLGTSASHGVEQIELSDLTVSVERGSVTLRSRTLARRVIPRLTYADNIHLAGVPAYRFLASVGDQGSLPSGWTWGPLDVFPDLPRVVYGRCILALARWRLDVETVRALAGASGDERRSLLLRLREERRIPRWVALMDRDRSLPVDTDSPGSVAAFLQIAAGGEAVLEEMFPGPGTPFFAGPEGGHAHELVLPFVRREPRSAPPAARTPLAPASPGRSRLPGEDWLYAKLYCNAGGADRILRDLVMPLVEETAGAHARWFFLRYGDPDWHLRLRFQGEPDALRERVLPALSSLAASARDAGSLHRLALDTYDPELERYGGPDAMSEVTELFHRDSEAALSLSVAYSDTGDARWRLALLGMLRLLTLLAPSMEERVEIARRARDEFAAEQGLVGRFARPIGERFRHERDDLVRLVRGEIAGGHPLRLGIDILDERDAHAAGPAERIVAALAGHPPDVLRNVAGSLLHLHANRVLTTDHRPQEAVLFDFLLRLLNAERARG